MASEGRAYSAGVFANFGPAIASGLRNFANFGGRASRPEFWYFVVFLYFAQESLFLFTKPSGKLACFACPAARQ
jgi:hypothetical protein